NITEAERLAEAVRALGVTPTAVQRQGALDPVLNLLSTANGPPTLKQSAQLVQTLGVSLSVGQQRAVLDNILRGIGFQHDGGLIYYLQTLQMLRLPLNDDDRHAVLVPVLADLRLTSDPEQFQTLTHIARAVLGQLTAEQIRSALAIVHPAL